MNVAVLLAGIADPKWPLGDLAAGNAGTAGSAWPRILSPFDESALEVALRLRDRRGDTKITTLLLSGGDAEPLARGVAAFRPDRLALLDAASLQVWDPRLLSAQLKAILAAEAPHFVLLGREFGDCDDGALAPCLAEQLGWPYAGMIQQIEWAEGGLRLMRERCGFEEWIALRAPLVASVTNDRRSRLRHPLMKNVVAARRATFVPVAAPPETEPSRVALRRIAPASEHGPRSACRFLDGTSEERIAELAGFLEAWRPTQ